MTDGEKAEALRAWMTARGFDPRQGCTLHVPTHEWEPWMPDTFVAHHYFLNTRLLLRPKDKNTPKR